MLLFNVFCKSFIPFMQDTPLEKLDRKHFAKGSRDPEQNGVAAAPQANNLKEIALMETKINKLCELLEEVSSCCIISYPLFPTPPPPPSLCSYFMIFL